MLKKLLLPLLVAAAFAAPAHAFNSGDLIAVGSLTGSSAGSWADLSGLTGTLENGAAANLLGGIGSGLTWAGGNTFLATPDRGPNAVAYNSSVDDTTSYIARFQTVTLDLTASASGSLPYTLTPTLTATTLLSSPVNASSPALNYGNAVGSGAPSINTASLNYFTGRSDNFGSGNSLNSLNARLDPEAIRVSNDGKSVFVSDEYGPYVYQFDRSTGQRIKSFTLPTELAVSNLSSVGATEISGNTIGRVANKGMEGLAITPDGKTLVGMMQAPLEQDGKKALRLVTIDIATGATHEYGYKLTNGSGVSEIVAINDHEFLVDERDGSGLGNGDSASVKQLFKIDITGATDIKGLPTLTTSSAGVTFVSKGSTPFLDIVSKLNAAGITSDKIPAKLEGVSFGQDFVKDGITYHTIYVANDNDFLSTATLANGTVVANPNNFYVFAVAASDLPSYTAQSIAAVPEPETYAMLLAGLGLIAGIARRRKR